MEIKRKPLKGDVVVVAGEHTGIYTGNNEVKVPKRKEIICETAEYKVVKIWKPLIVNIALTDDFKILKPMCSK